MGNKYGHREVGSQALLTICFYSLGLTLMGPGAGPAPRP